MARRREDRALRVLLVGAVALCVPPAPARAESTPPPAPTLDVRGLRVTAAPIPSGGARWGVGDALSAWDDDDRLVGSLRITTVRGDVAELTLLARAPHRVLRGARVAPHEPGAPSLAAPILHVDGDRVVTRLDAVTRTGDRGVVLDVSGQPVGGIEVTALDPTDAHADARLIFGRAAAGHDVRWINADRGSLQPPPLRVVVAEERATLSDILRARGWAGFEFSSAPGLTHDPDEAAVAAFGRRHAADIVVHGPTRCDDEACQPPAVASITPTAAEVLGRACPAVHPSCAPLTPTIAAGDPLPTPAAAELMLGHLAAATDRPHRAEWHLRRALDAGAYGPAQRPYAHLQLAEQATAAGDWSRARRDIAAASALAADPRAHLAIARVRLNLAHHAHDWIDARAQGHALVEQARRLDDPVTEAFAHRALGYAATELDAARPHFTAAAEAYRSVGDDPMVADAMAGLAGWLHGAGRSTAAATLLTEEVLPLYTAPADARVRANALSMLAATHRERGDHAEALRLLREAVLPIRRRRGDRRGVAVATGDIATTRWEQGERAAAERTLRDDVIPTLRALGADGAEACWVEHLAVLAMRRKDWSDARDAATEAAALYAGRGNEVGYARLLLVQAAAESALGYDLDARELQWKAWPILDAYGQTDDVAVTQLQLARSLTMTHEYRAAESMLRGWVIPRLQTSDPYALLGRAWRALGVVYALRKDLDGALRIYLEHELPVYEAAGARRDWAEAAAETASLLLQVGRDDDAIALWTDALPDLGLHPPAVQVTHRIALARALTRRGGPDDRAAARAVLADAQQIADGDAALIEQIDAARAER